MKNKLLGIITATALLALPGIGFGQAPTMGTTSNFVLFTSTGALVNTGLSQLTGHVGSNSGSSTGFGNVNGVMHNNNGTTGTAAADLNSLYIQLNTAVPAFFPAVLLGGSGQTLTPGVYSISANATLTNTLTLNGQNTSNAVFIIQINGTFASAANSKVVLINGAQACNVFWKTEGAVSLASGTSMKGNIVAHNAAITLNTGVVLEGRALSTTGAVSTNGTKAYTPTGCGSPYLNGPSAPALLSTACFVLFSSNGPVSNSGTTYATGDIGTNVGLTTGYVALNVTGTIHSIPDGSTSTCATDLGTVYTYMNGITHDIELLYPAQFGNKLVLTPHTYLLNAATMLTDTLFLNAEGNANATFLIKINGALSTSTFAVVALINGTQSKNVFWRVNGAINIGNNAKIKGTMVANNGAISLTTGVLLDGRALTTGGALSTAGMTATMPAGCGVAAPAPTINVQPVNKSACSGGSVSFSVGATGASLTYQWRKGTTNLVNGGNISGATTATLVINPATITDVATNYNVVVSGATSPSDVSTNVSLTMNSSPAITGSPVSQTVCSGSTVSFTASATGGGLTYQWRKGAVNMVNGGNISGANTASLTISPAIAGDAATNYNLVITGSCAPTLTTANTSLVITPGQNITSQPASQAVCAGSNAMFNVTANGTALTYQWKKGTTNITNGGNISGATTATLNISSATISDAASNYNVVVGGSCQAGTISAAVSLSVNSLPVIVTAPSNQTVCVDGKADFNVNASGSALTYQWRRGTVVLANGGNKSGVTTASLTINPVNVADTAGNYNVVITGICAPGKTSANAALVICTSTVTGITDYSKSGSAVNIYPNPFHGVIVITVNEMSLVNASELKLYNALGALVVKQAINRKTTTVNTGNLPAGVYYYNVSSGEKTIQAGKVISE